MLAELAGAFLAELITSISPCVIVMAPIILGSALRENRFYPLYTVAGLSIGFAAAGLLIDRLGATIGIGPGELRVVGAVMLVMFGVVLAVPALSERFSSVLQTATGPLQARMQSVGSTSSGPGAFALGLSLGVVWAPCVGPTLGAALVLAAQAGGAGAAFVIMMVYAVGTALPLLGIAYGGRGLARRVGALRQAGGRLKIGFGLILVVSGLVILAGLDKAFETWVLDTFDGLAMLLSGA